MSCSCCWLLLLLQGYNKKDHKHTVLYDEGTREYINLITTARKWELDDSKPPAKKPAAAGGKGGSAAAQTEQQGSGGGSAGSSKPKKAAGEGERPTGTRLIGHAVEAFQPDKQAWLIGTVQVGGGASGGVLVVVVVVVVNGACVMCVVRLWVWRGIPTATDSRSVKVD